MPEPLPNGTIPAGAFVTCMEMPEPHVLDSHGICHNPERATGGIDLYWRCPSCQRRDAETVTYVEVPAFWCEFHREVHVGTSADFSDGHRLDLYPLFREVTDG